MDRQERLRRRRRVAVTFSVLAWIGGAGLISLWQPLAVAIYAVLSLAIGAVLLAIDWDAL